MPFNLPNYRPGNVSRPDQQRLDNAALIDPAQTARQDRTANLLSIVPQEVSGANNPGGAGGGNINVGAVPGYDVMKPGSHPANQAALQRYLSGATASSGTHGFNPFGQRPAQNMAYDVRHPDRQAPDPLTAAAVPNTPAPVFGARRQKEVGYYGLPNYAP